MKLLSSMKKILKKSLWLFTGLLIVYLILLIPDSGSKTGLVKAGKRPFSWNRDELWQSMEKIFNVARQSPKARSDSSLQRLKNIAEHELAFIQTKTLSAADSNFILIENNFFNLAALVAANPGDVTWFTGYYNRLRRHIKHQSQQWDMSDTGVKNSLYTLLYGMRAAVEEVLLQNDTLSISPAMLVEPEKSVAPSTTIFGIEVHSGDILVSRGGAEVSALISRGNDYPGNFSHVALIYIEQKTNRPYLIEAHIEKGVATSSLDQYVKDKKLRFMVLRLRADLPCVKSDSMLPQKVAEIMYNTALSRHIPYDFKMNFHDTTAMFCSEVVSYAYGRNGVQLWQNISTISSPGVVNWLQDFGVENFVTQMPSDLEYDPQLTIVAEWRDPGTLFKDHIDNAAMDALLEKANNGETIEYNRWKLPLIRIVKAYCWFQNLFGNTGIIPEGMSATRALKNQTFVAMHNAVKNKTEQMAAAFMKQHGYRAPYWQLVKFAGEATKAARY